MRLLKVITGALLLTLPSLSYSNQLRYQLHTPAIEVLQTKDNCIDFRGDFSVTASPGQPALPAFAGTFLLPPDADLASVKITIKGSAQIASSIGQTVNPALPPHTCDGNAVWPYNPNIVGGKDTAVYNQNSFFPKGNLINYSTGIMREYKLVEVIYTPFSYNPVTKTLMQLFNPEITIDFETNAPTSIAPFIPKSFTTMVKQTAENASEILPAYTNSSKGESQKPSGYLIVTSNDLKSSLSSLNDFVKSKESHGLTVTVATESDWGGGTGAAGALNIRKWIQSIYKDKGIEYVLFIGNPSTGAVPMIKAYPDFSGSYQPYIDYLYADISGDLDLNKNGKYGEYAAFNGGDMAAGGVDKYADVHVGRIPVYANSSEANDILKKIIAYESTPQSDGAWRKTAFLPLNDFESGDGAMYGSQIESKILKPASWSYKTMYGNACSISGVVSAWNSGQYGIMIWQSHGTTDATTAVDVMSSSGAAGLSSKSPSHSYLVSCHCGKPEVAANCAYAVLKYQSVTVIGSAVQVLYSASVGTMGQGGDIRNRGYAWVQNMVNNLATSAVALDGSRKDIVMNSSTDWLNCIEMNLYGCPAIGTQSFAGSTGIEPIQSTNCLQTHRIVFNNNKIEIRFDHPLTNAGEVRLYNLHGKCIVLAQVSPGDSKITLTLSDRNTSKLSAGIYLLKVFGKNGDKTEQVSTDRIVVR